MSFVGLVWFVIVHVFTTQDPPTSYVKLLPYHSTNTAAAYNNNLPIHKTMNDYISCTTLASVPSSTTMAEDSTAQTSVI